MAQISLSLAKYCKKRNNKHNIEIGVYVELFLLPLIISSIGIFNICQNSIIFLLLLIPKNKYLFQDRKVETTMIYLHFSETRKQEQMKMVFDKMI
jgi:hypothetical protein